MNNDTTVNVQIKATDTASDVVKSAAGNFNDLWKQIALGEGVLALVQQGFQLLEQATIGSVKQAGDFQAQLVQLVTGAGESQKNLAQIGDGIKQIAIDTGTTLDQLTSGAYQIESAGFHGADALNLLKMAAEGAKADGADLGTVTNALTTIMHDYKIPASEAAQTTDEMIAAVARGKMHMQDFASSLSTVLPFANQIGLSFDQVAGAESTLTAGGVTANQATQDLLSVIRSLTAPTSTQVAAMQQMGLDSVSLSQNLGKNGLTGTLKEMFDAITAHMGPDGLVMQDALQNATLATKDMQTEIAALPSSVANLANQLMNGTISFAEYRKEARALPEGLGNLAQQFEGTYNKAHSFNDQLKAGINASPTFAAELKAMTGQTDAMNAVMMLAGDNFATFQDNVTAVGDAAKDSGKNISDWALIQQTFNQRWQEFQEQLQVWAVDFGELLLPALTDLLAWFKDAEPRIASMADKLFTFLEPSFHALWDTIKNKLFPALDELWKQIIEPLLPVLGDTFAGAVWLVTNALNVLLQILSPVISFIADHKELVIDFGLAFLALAGYMKFDAITSAFTSNMNTIMGSIGNVRGAVTTLFSKIAAGGVMGGIVTAGAMADIALVAQAVQSVLDAINTMNQAKSSISGNISSMQSSVSQIQDAMKSGKISTMQGEKMIAGIQGDIRSAQSAQSKSLWNYLFPGFRAMGGPVSANNPYIVGENGMELFVPNSSGTIIPAGQTQQILNNQRTNNQSVTIHQLVLPNVTNGHDFFKALNQDTLNMSMGLTPVQGAY